MHDYKLNSLHAEKIIIFLSRQLIVFKIIF